MFLTKLLGQCKRLDKSFKRVACKKCQISFKTQNTVFVESSIQNIQI